MLNSRHKIRSTFNLFQEDNSDFCYFMKIIDLFIFILCVEGVQRRQAIIGQRRELKFSKLNSDPDFKIFFVIFHWSHDMLFKSKFKDKKTITGNNFDQIFTSFLKAFLNGKNPHRPPPPGTNLKREAE